jgi:hypothetical protein
MVATGRARCAAGDGASSRINPPIGAAATVEEKV